jgi:PPK2 family polyphosphate:nucleotide phosphotransferase
VRPAAARQWRCEEAAVKRPDWVIATPQRVRLADYDPNDTGDVSQEQAQRELSALLPRIAELQDLLYGAGKHAALIVLQGLDTAGKDGTIKHVTTPLNPLGCRVASFKAPSEEERSHDYLWRIHQQVPPRGIMTIFNRSHYEDVLVARVRHLAPAAAWRGRYHEINQFERMLARNDVLMMKFYLHISNDEQQKRLRAREDDPDKAWKLSVGDWEDRAYWDDYQAAYADALGRCGTSWAPWRIVPANHKWYRNYVVARRIVELLSVHERGWRKELEARGGAELARLAAYRASGGQNGGPSSR